MTTKKKLVWRLGKLPSVDELRELVKDKIITNDEAREILFSNDEVEERDKKSFEGEIKFLRDLVEQLSKKNNSTIIETIKIIEQPYYHQKWYNPYKVWCTSGNTSYSVTTNSDSVYPTVNAAYQLMDNMDNATSMLTDVAKSFNSIKTF
jgi:hypothetical protein